MVLIEIIAFPSLHLNKNAFLMIRNYVFIGTVSASTPLSTQLIGLLNGIINFETRANDNFNQKHISLCTS